MDDRPTVTVTMAQSLDGRIATVTGQSQWISGDETLSLAQQMRAESDSILVGVGTVIADNPKLTCRIPGSDSPLRVVLDSSLRIPLGSEVVATAGIVPTVIYVGPGVGSGNRKQVEQAGAEIVVVEPDCDGRPDPRRVLADLYHRGVRSTMVEGGSKIITGFLRAGLVDRIVAVIAPMIIGHGINTVGDLAVTELRDAIRGRTKSLRRMGDDVVWEVVLNDG